ncbi:DUF1254 domain-containing protein [Streptomyces sp. SKN60]|uniref:DUF1254 domain-containing protein n=1 Tax=Streptomyces sp. SKN60 TaxID=2855506 RepID=UPI00224568E4|nr:DUF1254 domain-containing protein [Streptomyces sp. SKN60]MCX2180664.1 DUF1254 domain-containing protein [Streptomyces sp. SKN60]
MTTTETQATGESAALTALAAEAYVFAYPLVTMELTRRQMTTPGAVVPGSAAPNTFAHLPVTPDASFEGVVSPNADTLYSLAWLDLSAGPVRLSVPDTRGRYFLLPLYDAWTNVFACPGSRTTGSTAGEFALVGPGWAGELPAGVERIDAPTSMVAIIGRTQVNGVADYPAVHAVQAGYRLTPLTGTCTDPDSASAVAAGPGPVDLVTAPVDQVAALDPATFFAMTAHLMAANPAKPDDAPMVERLARLGVVPGRPFDWDSLSPEDQQAIAQGAAEGIARVEAAGRSPRARVRDGWMTPVEIGAYGTDYLQRAAVTLIGLGANLPEDAVYPVCRVDGDGEPLHGRHRYRLHFAADGLPPVNAFWSLTMYNDRQFFVDNPIDRYAVGDRDALKFDADGSLTLLIQHTAPAEGPESNWLPAPEGSFNLMMRLFWPGPAVLGGTWHAPAVRRVG